MEPEKANLEQFVYPEINMFLQIKHLIGAKRLLGDFGLNVSEFLKTKAKAVCQEQKLL